MQKNIKKIYPDNDYIIDNYDIFLVNKKSIFTKKKIDRLLVFYRFCEDYYFYNKIKDKIKRNKAKNDFYVLEFSSNNKILCINIKNKDIKNYEELRPIGKFISNDIYTPYINNYTVNNFKTFYIKINYLLNEIPLLHSNDCSKCKRKRINLKNPETIEMLKFNYR